MHVISVYLKREIVTGDVGNVLFEFPNKTKMHIPVHFSKANIFWSNLLVRHNYLLFYVFLLHIYLYIYILLKFPFHCFFRFHLLCLCRSKFWWQKKNGNACYIIFLPVLPLPQIHWLILRSTNHDHYYDLSLIRLSSNI